MPKKVSREERKRSGSRLNESKKIVPPHKRKKEATTIEATVEATSSSSKKISETTTVKENLETHYRIIDFLLVFTTLATLVKCAVCGGKISFKSCSKEGLGFTIKVTCEKCRPHYIQSSKKIHSRIYEINYRFTFAMRVLGLGLVGCDKLCGLLDLASTFVSKSTYHSYITKINEIVQKVASNFFASAVQEEKEETCKANNIPETSDLTISGDGTWKKRGFSSLYGVVSLVGHYTGKVLDIFVQSSYCHNCEVWKNKLNTAEYEEWIQIHTDFGECKANHIGPSGNMEVKAIVTMFSRSLENFGVRYQNYIGDGDSKTYTGVVNSKPYGDFRINEKECVGHVQKRMGTRLRTLVKTNVVETETKTGKTVKRKSLSGKGKLTAKTIDKLTIYYGLAIRRNHDSIEKMKNAIWATYDHYSSTDKNPQHSKCPTGSDSWCEYQKSAAENNLDTFRHSYTALPDDVLIAIKPIYEDLSKEALLKRCLGGFNQNNNESLNQLVWKISPKSVSGTSVTVEIAAYVAACVFNEGSFSLLTIMEELQIKCGTCAHEWARATDNLRISRADKKTAMESKEGRIRRRLEQKDALDILNESSSLYGPGIDDSV